MKNKGYPKGSFYRKSLLVILLVTSIPGLITGLGIYLFAVGSIEQDLKALHSSQMQERVHAVDETFSYFELALSQWASDPRFDQDLMQQDLSLRFKETQDLSKALQVLQGSHPMIEQVSLYVEQEDASYLFNPDYSQVHDPKVIEEHKSFMRQGTPIAWSTKPIQWRGASQDGPSKTEPVIMLSHLLGNDDHPFGALVVTLKPEHLLDLLMTLTPYHEGTTFLMNEDHNILISSQDGPEGEVFERSLREDIQKSGEHSGSFVKRWKGTVYSVSYGDFHRLNKQWTYVAAAPMTAITSPVVLASKIILIISGCVLLTALVLAWIASHKIYSPIGRLVRLLTRDAPSELGKQGMDEFKLLERQWQHITRESKSLQLRLEEEMPQVKNGFLIQLIQGHLHAYTEKDLRERMKHYGWQVSHKQFTIATLQLTGLSHLKDRFVDGDEGLVTFAAANIIDELASQRLEQYNILNFHNLSIGILIITPLEEPNHAAIHVFARELTDAINRLLKLKVTITISRPTVMVSTLPELFMDVTQAASFRLFKDENQIIDMEELIPIAKESGGEYPFLLDREITQSMRMGQLEETEQLIDQFLEEVFIGQRKEYLVQQCVLQLFGSIQYTIMQSGMQPDQLFGGVNMFDRLAQIREPQQLAKCFKEEVIHPYIAQIEERSNVQLKHMVEVTMEYLQQHYMEDISLESCAEMVGTTSYTLSKAFKQIAGVNFVDYVTQYRMDRAKELLRTTDLKISDIATHVGYQHSYFNRIFKRNEGVTPGQYRSKWQDQLA
ncbi:helix-turn-helix domain-containing protein [Marinicrinis lubricantis]|uniref:Helix-turn-helix domain-containing protein n=1 Tax=Marinicrinis lubricantis TaxID=2086470 RepID=A0ABW1ILB8_9BACL